jgi:hypothetical protein
MKAPTPQYPIYVKGKEINSLTFPDKCAYCNGNNVTDQIKITLAGFKQRILLIPYCSKHARRIKFNRSFHVFTNTSENILVPGIAVLAGLVVGVLAGIFFKYHGVFDIGSRGFNFYVGTLIGITISIIVWGLGSYLVSLSIKDSDEDEAVEVRAVNQIPYRYLLSFTNKDFADEFVQLNRKHLA